VKSKVERIKGKIPDIRHLNDMRRVVYDKKWLKTAPNSKLYYMYRKIKKKGGLVHNITVIPSRMLGKEFVKTKGHYHVGNYGELYIVFKGEAIFLMQKKQGKEIKDVYYVKARKRDIVIIPPGYGHIMINPSKKDLKTGDWSSEKCRSDYSQIEKKGGACYFYTKSGWIKNKNYKNVPKIHFKKPKKSMPKSLDFLK
jgi:glucose-6-phosphate isomerase